MAEIGRSDARYDRFGAARLPTTAAIRNTALSAAPILLALSLIWPTSISAALGGINLPAHRIVLIFLLPFAAAELVRKRIRVEAPDIFVFAFAILQAVSLSIHHGWTDDIVIYLRDIPVTTTTLTNAGATFIDTVGPYLIARAYIRTLPQFLSVAKLLVGIIIGIGVFTLIESLTGQTILGTPPIINAGSRLGLVRSSGPFPHPILWGLFAASAFSLSVMDRPGQRSVLQRGLPAALVAIAALTSVSSGAFLVLLIQIMLLSWNYLTRGVPRRWIIFFGLVLVAYGFIEALSTRSAILVITSYATLDPWTAYYRTLIWQFGWQNFLASPLLGIGYNDWVRPSWMTSSIDAFWLVMLLRYGLLACVPLYLGILTLLFRVGNRIDERRNRGVTGPEFAWMVCIFSVLVAAFTVHLWGQIYVHFFFLLGMWGSMTRRDSITGPRRNGAEA